MLDGNGLIFVELLQCIREADVDRVDAEPSAEHPLLHRVPCEADAGLEVLPVSIVQSAGWMDDGAHSARERIGCCRIEVAFEAVLRMERALGGPAQAEVESQILREFPVVLKIEAVDVAAAEARCSCMW